MPDHNDRMYIRGRIHDRISGGDRRHQTLPFNRLAHPYSPSRSLRFIHIADVHLDTAFAGRSDGLRNRLRQTSREAFARCVAAAVSEKVDAVLIAGDFFDGTRLSFETERFLLTQLAVLAEAGIQVVYATGNHDPGQGPRAGGLDWPATVSVIPGEEPKTVPVRNRTGDTAGYVTAAGHATSRETADLSRRLAPLPGTSLPQVALLHTQTTSASEGDVHQPYAPSNLDFLRNAGFHYWALGHVHLRQELCANPAIHYCGNLHGRNPRETGAKGGLLVNLGDPAHPVVEFREFSRVRWEKLKVPGLEGARTLEGLVSEVTGAWEEARSGDPGGADTEWMVAVDLVGPSPMWRELGEPEEVETIEEEVGQRLGALGVEIRASRVHPQVRLEDHVARNDVLGATLRLSREVLAGTERLGLSDADLAGFDAERDGSLDAYLRRLMEGGGEEIVTRMLEAEGTRE